MILIGWLDMCFWMLFWDDGLYMNRWCKRSFVIHAHGLNWFFLLLANQKFFDVAICMNMYMGIWGMTLTGSSDLCFFYVCFEMMVCMDRWLRIALHIYELNWTILLLVKQNFWCGYAYEYVYEHMEDDHEC